MARVLGPGASLIDAPEAAAGTHHDRQAVATAAVAAATPRVRRAVAASVTGVLRAVVVEASATGVRVVVAAASVIDAQAAAQVRRHRSLIPAEATAAARVVRGAARGRVVIVRGARADRRRRVTRAVAAAAAGSAPTATTSSGASVP